MALTINQWGADVTGRAVRNNNPNQPVAQCTELWRDFLVRVVEAPHNAGFAPNGYAYSLYTMFGATGPSNNNSIAPTHLVKVPRSQGGQRGDAIIWAANVPRVTGVDGHVAVLDEDLGSTVSMWSQNDAASPGRTRHTGFTAEGILGFLRPKKFITNPPTPTPTPEEAIDMAYLPDLFMNKTGVAPVDQGVAIFANGYVKTLTQSGWDAFVYAGARVYNVTVPGHWAFHMDMAAQVRAANTTPA